MRCRDSVILAAVAVVVGSTSPTQAQSWTLSGWIKDMLPGKASSQTTTSPPVPGGFATPTVPGGFTTPSVPSAASAPVWSPPAAAPGAVGGTGVGATPLAGTTLAGTTVAGTTVAGGTATSPYLPKPVVDPSTNLSSANVAAAPSATPFYTPPTDPSLAPAGAVGSAAVRPVQPLPPSLPGYGGTSLAGGAYGAGAPSASTGIPTGALSALAASPYGAPAGSSPYGCTTCEPGCLPANWFDNLTLFNIYDAFKGPLDLDGQNANFGSRVGLYGAVPIYAPWGLAAQLGSSAGWYDWKGSPFAGGDERFQNFITAGVFQRSCVGLNWGVAYDWLFDDYYSDFEFQQLRGAVSYQLTPATEIGVWGAAPMLKDSAVVGTPPVDNTFKPVAQANLFWRQTWAAQTWTNTFVGWAEKPEQLTFGSSAQFALNRFVAVTGGFQYYLPATGDGSAGYEDEIWNASFGLVFYPGSALQAANSPLRPMLPMADNGNFAIYRQ